MGSPGGRGQGSIPGSEDAGEKEEARPRVSPPDSLSSGACPRGRCDPRDACAPSSRGLDGAGPGEMLDGGLTSSQEPAGPSAKPRCHRGSQSDRPPRRCAARGRSEAPGGGSGPCPRDLARTPDVRRGKVWGLHQHAQPPCPHGNHTEGPPFAPGHSAGRSPALPGVPGAPSPPDAGHSPGTLAAGSC